MADRRHTPDYTKWIGIIAGTFAILGTLIGAAIAWDRHAQLDVDLADRIKKLEGTVHDMDLRIYKLEWAHDENHPGDAPLHIANQK